MNIWLAFIVLNPTNYKFQAIHEIIWHCVGLGRGREKINKIPPSLTAISGNQTLDITHLKMLVSLSYFWVKALKQIRHSACGFFLRRNKQTILVLL